MKLFIFSLFFTIICSCYICKKTERCKLYLIDDIYFIEKLEESEFESHRILYFDEIITSIKNKIDSSHFVKLRFRKNKECFEIKCKDKFTKTYLPNPYVYLPFNPKTNNRFQVSDSVPFLGNCLERNIYTNISYCKSSFKKNYQNKENDWHKVFLSDSLGYAKIEQDSEVRQGLNPQKILNLCRFKVNDKKTLDTLYLKYYNDNTGDLDVSFQVKNNVQLMVCSRRLNYSMSDLKIIFYCIESDQYNEIQSIICGEFIDGYSLSKEKPTIRTNPNNIFSDKKTIYLSNVRFIKFE